MKKMRLLFGILLMVSFCTSISQNSFEVKKTGKGQPILMLPGFACTSEVFDNIKDSLASSYEVHAFTFAGFGGVPPISFPWLPQIKTDIETYVLENNLNNPIIIGHSLGGTLGLWLVSDSKKYSNLIVIDALPAMGDLMMADYDSEAMAYENPYNDRVLAMTDKEFKTMALQSAGYMTNLSEKQLTIANWIIASDRKTYVYGYTDLLKLDLRGSLHKLEVPVHIFAATEPYGKEMVASTYKKQYQNLKGYKIKFAEGSGHFIMFDNPKWLNEQIQTALETNE